MAILIFSRETPPGCSVAFFGFCLSSFLNYSLEVKHPAICPLDKCLHERIVILCNYLPWLLVEKEYDHLCLENVILDPKHIMIASSFVFWNISHGIHLFRVWIGYKRLTWSWLHCWLSRRVSSGQLLQMVLRMFLPQMRQRKKKINQISQKPT